MRPPTLEICDAAIVAQRANFSHIDVARARRQPAVLDLVREACLIESYFPVYMGELMTLLRDDLDATSSFAIETFEAYTHFLLLRRYLQIVRYKPVRAEEIIQLRARGRRQVSRDPVRELVNFMLTEHFAAHFFHTLSRRVQEPVLKKLLARFAGEEVVHARFAFDLLRKRVAGDPRIARAILRHAVHFKHVGAYALPTVSVAGKENLGALRQLDNLLQELTGTRLSKVLATAPRSVRTHHDLA